MRTERPEGANRSSSRRSPAARRGTEAAALAARARGRERLRDPLPPATGGTSPPAGRFLRDRDRAEQPHLVLELYSELLACTAASLGEQRECVRRGCAARVLDE